jgi:GTP cyclohydrolase II
MAKDSNIVHQYFKKEMAGHTLLVKVNPLQLKAVEITLQKGQEPELREMEVDADIIDDLKMDGFTEASPIEFNLYLSGLIK